MNNENLRKIYEQYWLHARHQELQRLSFTNIYAVVVAGVFAYMGATHVEEDIKSLLLFFLMLLSFFGYSMIHFWNVPFVIFSYLAEEIAIRELNLPVEYARFTEHNTRWEKYNKAKRLGRLPIRDVRDVFIAFYSLMIAIFGALIFGELIFQKMQNAFLVCCNIKIIHIIIIQILLGVIIFTFFYIVYCKWLKHDTDELIKEFNESIKKYLQKKKGENELFVPY